MSSDHRWHGPAGMWPKTADGKYVVTQSMVSSFVGCPREVYYSIVLGLRPRLQSMPLTRGTWVHSLLEERANGGDWRVKHQSLLEEARAEQFDEEVDGLATECYNIMISYDWIYRHDDLFPIMAELTVERPMLHNTALYRGRIDLIVQDKNGDIWLVDHKTHARLPDWRYRELAFQHYSYLWACRKAPQYLALGIPQPRGFIYDYVRTGAIRTPKFTQTGHISKQGSAAGTTFPVFVDWLKQNHLMTRIRGKNLLAITDEGDRKYVESMIVELKNKSYDDLFRRDTMEFTKDQSLRQLKSFLCSVNRMLHYDWSDPDKVERNLHECSDYMCNYKDLTLSDLMHGNSDLEQRTRYVKTRDPLSYYPQQDAKRDAQKLADAKKRITRGKRTK